MRPCGRSVRGNDKSTKVGLHDIRRLRTSPHGHQVVKPQYVFIIGAQRSGTTLLAEVLDSHPGVSFAKPLRPEPKYFLRPDSETSREDYESRYFSGLSAEVMRGEKSTSYIEYERVAQRIATLFPTGLCIALLRDPVERAVSNYWFSVQHGHEKRSPEEALNPETQNEALVPGVSASPFAYLRRGRYLGYLETYARVLGRDRLLVLQTEHLVHENDAWPQVYSFLGLDALPPPPDSVRINGMPREREVAETTLTALARYFAPSNAALAERFGMDLDLWRRPA